MTQPWEKVAFTAAGNMTQLEYDAEMPKWMAANYRYKDIVKVITVDGAAVKAKCYKLANLDDYIEKYPTVNATQVVTATKFHWDDENDNEAKAIYEHIVKSVDARNARIAAASAPPPMPPPSAPVLAPAPTPPAVSAPPPAAPPAAPAAKIEYKEKLLTGFVRNGANLEIENEALIIDVIKNLIKEFGPEQFKRLREDEGGMNMWPYVQVIHGLIVKSGTYDMYPILVNTLGLRKKTSEVVYTELKKIPIFQGKNSTVNKSLIRCMASVGLMIADAKDEAAGNLIKGELPVTPAFTFTPGADGDAQMKRMVQAQSGKYKFEEGLKRMHAPAKLHWDLNKAEYSKAQADVVKAFDKYKH